MRKRQIDEYKLKDETMEHNRETEAIKGGLSIHKRKRNIFFMLIITVVILLPIAYALTLEPEKSSVQKEGLTPAPNFFATDVITGETITLDKFKSNVLLLNFVNYGCNQGINQIVSEQLLTIKSLKKQRNDFVPISVFCGCCPERTLRNFALENNLQWPWILDTENTIIKEYNDYVQKYGYPTLVFINKNQYIEDFSGYCDDASLSIKLDKLSD